MQPPHREHIEMIGRLLLNHSRVFIGITNPEPSTGLRAALAPHRDGSAGNPFSYEERRHILDVALQDDGADPDTYSIVPFPLEHPDAWSAQIPPEALQYVRVFGPWEQKKVKLLAEIYEVQVIDDEPKRSEGEEVRSALADGRIPEKDLHPTTVAELSILLKHLPYRDRIAQ